MKKPVSKPKAKAGRGPNEILKCAAWVNTGLAGFINTTFSEWWDTKGFDRSLRRALLALRMVGADAFVVKIAGRSLLTYCAPALRSSSLLPSLESAVHKSVKRALTQGSWEDGFRLKLDERHLFAIKRIPVRDSEGLSAAPDDPRDQARQSMKGLSADDLNFCAYSYAVGERKRQKLMHESPEEDFARRFAQSVCLVLFDIFRNREHRLSAFPKEISERYWLDSISPRDPTADCLSPPWEGTGKEGHRTATLSIDLRRSTFCMEQADQGWQFGVWLDQLVKILTAVTHRNGGVFDKFTGDGALVHFLERETQVVYGRDAVSAAVQCAVEMQEAVGIHLKRLRAFLRFDSEKLGAGVAIDLSEAFWSIDGGDSPIVVGRGVVGACRVGGGASAGAVRLSNVAWSVLSPEIKTRLQRDAAQVGLKTKEWSEDMAVTAWEFMSPLWPNSGVAALCEAVYKNKVALSLGR